MPQVCLVYLLLKIPTELLEFLNCSFFLTKEFLDQVLSSDLSSGIDRVNVYPFNRMPRKTILSDAHSVLSMESGKAISLHMSWLWAVGR